MDHRDPERTTIGVYEVESGRKLLTIPGTNSTFARDGRSLVTWNGYGGRRTARRVDLVSGMVTSEFTCSDQFPDAAGRSDGRWFFEITDDNGVRVRDAVTGKPIHTFTGPGGGAGPTSGTPAAAGT